MIRDGRVIDSNGQLDEQASELIAEQAVRIHDLEDELARYRRKVAGLQGDQYSQQSAKKHFEAAMRVLEAWRELCMPTARELRGARCDQVIARFNGGETEERLMRSVLGYSRYPYLVNWRRVRTGSKAQWKADAEFVFRNAKNVEAGIRLAELDEDYEQVFQAPPDPELSPLGKTALRCAAMGWHVFPCWEDRKQPACVHGLLDATTDRHRIVEHWSKQPFSNLAIRTGMESGLIVLDVDGEDGFASLRGLEAKYGEMPATLSVVTPSGGQHFYWVHPGHEIRNSASLVAPGIDIRGDGGYVLCPPSKVDGRPYEVDEFVPVAEMPEWLVKGLLEYQLRQATKGKGQWAELIQRGVTAGARNTEMLSLIGKLVASRMSSEQVAVIAHSLNRSHCRPPLQASEIDKIVQSCLKMHHR